jgi:3-isopropylmalate/(R)-2-methylmalate dehydratase large subunit
MGIATICDPGKTVLFLDHASPSPRKELSNDHMLLRDFAEKTGCHLSDVGSGISHHVAAESFVNPGNIVVGADSHTVTGGALGAFATGMGSTDVGVAIAFCKTWMRVPETIRVVVEGELPKGVYGKDIILHLIGKISARGATYKALEFVGTTIDNLSQAGRMTIANMSVEAGAKVGIFSTDETTKAFLKEMGREDRFREIHSDPDARFEQVIEIDATKLEPTIACPHLVDNVKTIEEIGHVQVHQVFIGTSCNGRLEDFQIAAGLLKGKRIASGVRLLCTPASRRVLLDGMQDGTFQTLIEAGGVVTGPGCGATQPRNFKGRMGNPNSFIYLGSPATAAVSALAGEIADPRKLL